MEGAQGDSRMSGWAAANGDIAPRAGDHSCGRQGAMDKVEGVGDECRWHQGSARTGSGVGKSVKVVQSQCTQGPARRLHLILLRICAGSRWGEDEARMCSESCGKKGTGRARPFSQVTGKRAALQGPEESRARPTRDGVCW